MSTSKRHRRFSPEEKAAIVRRNLIEKAPVSEICEEHKISPSMFYKWRTQLFENASLALQDRRRRRIDPQTRELKRVREQTAKLEAQLRRKDEVIAQLAEENVDLKKADGGT